jgi:membrane-associated phospholipid phosphatase
VLVLALLCFVLFGRARAVVWDWLPFVFVGVMFQDLTPLATQIAGHVHEAGPIAVEKTLLGGNVAATWLQFHIVGLLGATGSMVLQTILVAEYLFHFAAPMVTGLWLWSYHRHALGGFVGAYIAAMCAGFLIYLLYPETPPWLAAQQGSMPAVHRFVVEWLGQFGSVGTLYAGADTEPNAAMPSLHVTIPMIIACTAIMVRGWRVKRNWLWLAYPLTISFGVLYLGEHYVLDVVAGVVLGIVCVVAGTLARRAGTDHRPPPRPVGVLYPP